MAMKDRYNCEAVPNRSSSHLSDRVYSVMADKVLMLALYDRYSVNALGQLIGVGNSTVQRYLTAHGVTFRTQRSLAPCQGEPLPVGLSLPENLGARTPRQQVRASVQRLYMLASRCARAHCPYACDVLEGEECRLEQVLRKGGDLDRRSWEPEAHEEYWSERLRSSNGREP